MLYWKVIVVYIETRVTTLKQISKLHLCLQPQRYCIATHWSLSTYWCKYSDIRSSPAEQDNTGEISWYLVTEVRLLGRKERLAKLNTTSLNSEKNTLYGINSIKDAVVAIVTCPYKEFFSIIVCIKWFMVIVLELTRRLLLIQLGVITPNR